MKRFYNRREIKRCPKCKSGNFHKRVRCDHSKGDKIYKCYKCGHEFDTPVIGRGKVENTGNF